MVVECEIFRLNEKFHDSNVFGHLTQTNLQLVSVTVVRIFESWLSGECPGE